MQKKKKHIIKDLFLPYFDQWVELRTQILEDLGVEDHGYLFIKNNGDGYVYSIKTYKHGFLSWIMGQEKGVVVLEPESIREEIVTRLKNTLKYYGEEMQ